MNKTSRPNRILSMFLALVMVLGMIPANMLPVRAVGGAPNIKVNSVTMSETYQSGAFGTVHMHRFDFIDDAGQIYTGLCADHSKNAPSKDVTYTVQESFTSEQRPWLCFVLDAYYDQVDQGINDIGANTLAQIALWAWVENKWNVRSTSTDSATKNSVFQGIGAERISLVKNMTGTAPSEAETQQLLEDMWTGYQNGVSTRGTYYIYNSSDSKRQPILIRTKSSDPPPPVEEHKTAWISLMKVDQGGNGLVGAQFTIYTDSSCQNVAISGTGGSPVITTDASGYGAASVSWQGNFDSKTFYVKETQAPAGKKPNKNVYSVTVSASANGTESSAANVMGGSGIPNRDPQKPTGIVNKVDANTGAGIGPATFNFKGTDKDGNPIDRNVACDENGVLEVQWSDPDKEKYFEPGEYTVTEVIPPNGYEKSDEVFHLSLRIVDDVPSSSGPITFKNYEKHKVVILKKSNDGEPLPGAVFDVRLFGQKIASVTTGPDGSVTFEGTDGQGIKSGWYDFEEVQAPSGYQLPYNRTQGIYVNAESTEIVTHVLTFTNYTWPEIIIKKTEAGTNIPLGGAMFEVMIDGANLGTYKSQPDGTVCIKYDVYKKFWNEKNLTHTVAVREVQAPENHLLDDDDWKINHITEGQALSEFAFSDSPYPRIRINKYEAGTDTLIPGATFEIRINGVPIPGSFKALNGTKLISYDEYGRFLGDATEIDKDISHWTVEVREVDPPDGYLLDDDDWQTVELARGQTIADFTFNNTPYPEILIKKYDSGTKHLLPGATFQIQINGRDLGTFKNETGELKISYDDYKRFLGDTTEIDQDISHWTIQVREVTAPDGYLITDPDWHTVELARGMSTAEFDFEDTPYPEIWIRKVDRETGEGLPNTSFGVAINGTNIEGPLVTDKDGYVKLTYDDYRRFLGDMEGSAVSPDGWGVTVTELEMPEKYNKDKQEGSEGGDGYTITQHLQPGQQRMDFTFKDTHYRSIKVIKRDSSNTWLLRGAVFTLESINLEQDGSTKITREGKTDENGQFIFEDVPNGTYLITEKIPPTGYERSDPTTQTVTVTSMSDRIIEVEFKNAPKQGLLITKHDAITGKALPGTKFTVRYLGQADESEGTSNTAVEYITDDNGTIYLPDLQAGFYEIIETGVPDGYVIDSEPRIIHVVNKHGSYVVDYQNYQDTQLVVLKEDAQTGLPLAGARFVVTTAGGNWIADIVTGPNGCATLAGLEPGAYVIKEVDAPDGHIIDPVPQTFEIRVAQTEPIFKVFKNDGKSNLFIRKEDEQTRLPLAGAVFKVSLPNGKVVKPRVTTGPDGLVRISDLEPGAYVVEEIEAPQGYTFIKGVTQIANVEAGTTVSVLFRNNKPGGIAILKRDAVSGLPLANAEFKVSDVDHKPVGSYKTGEDGYIRIPNLDEGYYFIQETKAPRGYILNDTEHQVYVEDFKVTLVELENYEDSTLVVNKVDEQTKVPLAGAKFAVYSMNGTQQGKAFITGSNGKASLGSLKPGWYIVKELEAPDGYVLNKEEYRIEVIKGQPVTLTVPNVPESGITVQKVDSVTREPLAGAHFELLNSAGKLIDSYVSDVSGSFVTRPVQPGVYYLKEVKAPDGYALLNRETRVTVAEGDHPFVTIENHKNTTIEIQKVDSVTGEYLEGAEFEVWTYDKTKLVGTYTTDAAGIAFAEPLDAGDYIVVESKAPAGYVKSDEHYHVQVSYDHPAILKVANVPLTGIMISKLSAVDDHPLIGAKFEVRTAEGDVVGEFATDTAGDPIIAVEPGVYYVHETKAPDGYIITDEVFRIEVTAGKVVPLVVRNDPKPSLLIFKSDAETGKGVAGAIFRVETPDGAFIGQYTTDAQGEALIQAIDPGHYLVKEMSAPDGYVISEKCTKSVVVKAGVINRIEFRDAELGSLVIRLEDKNDGHKLENGRFELYWAETGDKIKEGVTDNSGSIVWGSLVPGDYIIKQTYAPDGYTKVDAELRATVVSGETRIVVFKDVTSGLVIEKIDRNTKEALSGARFQVIRNSDNIVIGEYVTDVDGLALVSGLTPGMYTVNELVAPANYEIDTPSQLVHVKDSEYAHVTFEDTPWAGINVTAVDQGTKAPIAGVVIEVWRQNGELINTYTTDNTGVIQTDKLSNGFYVVRVIRAGNGYTAVTKEQTVEIKNGVAVSIKFEFVAGGVLQIFGLSADETGLAGMKVKVTKIDGSVIGEFATDVTGIIKLSELEAGWYTVTVIAPPNGYTAAGKVTENVEVTSNGVSALKFYFDKTYGVQIQTSISQTGMMVEGVKYQIARLDGSVVGVYTSNAAGLLYAQLDPGWYQVTMLELPASCKGFEMCPARNIEVIAGQPAFMSFVLTQLSGMRVKVVDGVTSAPLYGVSILLKDANGTIVDQYTTNNEGYITLSQAVVNGTYTLTMIEAPNGYTVDPVPKTIEVLNGQTTEIVWQLYSQAGQIQVHVTSSEYNATLDKAAGSNLQGAVFEIYDPFSYAVVAVIESDSYGVAASAGLPIGRYIIREKTPAPYYGLSGKEAEVYIKVNNDVVRVEYQEAPVYLKVAHAMTGIANINPGTFGKFIFTKVDNESDTRVDNFYWNIKIPTDAVRAGVLYTGKWSADVRYSIKYKTNMNDFRVLAENLSSSIPYQYDLSSIALDSQSGEYVTDILFEFGTVPAGFKVVAAPIFYNYVMPMIPSGFLVITRSECGGKIGEAWKTETALWTTTVVGKAPGNSQLPGSLPKTGY